MLLRLPHDFEDCDDYVEEYGDERAVDKEGQTREDERFAGPVQAAARVCDGVELLVDVHALWQESGVGDGVADVGVDAGALCAHREGCLEGLYVLGRASFSEIML